MMNEFRGDVRDTGLDIAEIGAQVRDQLISLVERNPDLILLKGWLRTLERDPNQIIKMYPQIFVYLRQRTSGDDALETTIAAWEERLNKTNT